ncbi:MAG: class I SAM-dependent methyltransferase, partial [Anaerolineae bacterium]|nr:class I SAM-dependent methyltransferase [Anaerolineae bacterium]
MMEDQQVLTPETKSDSGYDPFEIQAEFGITKHMGGVDATDILAKHCQIDAGSHVLDAGCGVGITPISLAQQYGCTVVGVDIRDSMIARARERARKEQLTERVQFRVADVQQLPFEDNQFDAVISESV